MGTWVAQVVVVRVLLVMVVVLALGALRPTPAQAGDVEVLRLLESQYTEEVAWGAWNARSGAGPRVIERVVSRIEEVLDGCASLRPAMVYLLDAAIRLEAPIHPRMAARLIARYPTPGTVWHCRVARQHPESLLRAFRRVEMKTRERMYASTSWVALGNQLARVRPRGFAATVLGDLRFHVTVRVHSGRRSKGWGSPSGHVAGDGWRTRADGYPPLPTYEIALESEVYDQSRWTTLATGLHGVLVRRTVQTLRERGFGIVAGSGPDIMQLRMHWLRTLLDGHTPPPLFASDVWRIRYVGERPLQRRVERNVQGLHARIHLLLDALVARQQLTPLEAAQVTPHLELIVRDERVDRRQELPVLTPPMWQPRARPTVRRGGI